MFGISLSVLFVAIWGRAVVIDTDALAESMAPLAGSAAVVDFVTDWMGEEMVESGIDPNAVEPAIDFFLDSSALGVTADRFAGEVVDAAASSDPGGASIDMRALIAPAIPEVTVGLTSLGYDVSDAQIRQVVEGFDPLVIRQPGSPALLGPASEAASRLGTASVLAAVALVIFGSGFVGIAGDRVGAVRNLLNRVAVGGLSFAVLLRLGSWVLDPDGGRAPVPETVSNLAESKWMVPLQIAIVAAVLGGAIYLGRRVVKQRAKTLSPGERATRPAEQQESLTGSR